MLESIRKNRWLRSAVSAISLAGLLGSTCLKPPTKPNQPPETKKPTLLQSIDIQNRRYSLDFQFGGSDPEDGEVRHFKFNLRKCYEPVNWWEDIYSYEYSINTEIPAEDRCHILTVKAVDSQGLEDETPETFQFNLEGILRETPIISIQQYEESLEKTTTKESGEVKVLLENQETTIKVVNREQQPLEDIVLTFYNNPEKRATIIVASDPTGTYFPDATFLIHEAAKPAIPIPSKPWKIMEILRTDYRPYYIHIIPDFPDFVPDDEKGKISDIPITLSQLPDFYGEHDSAWNNTDILEYILGESAVGDPFFISLNNARKKVIEKAPMITDLLGRVREYLGEEGMDSDSWYLDVYNIQVEYLKEILPILVHRTNYKDKYCTLKGKVLDPLGNPAQGALVWADNDSTDITDAQGNYTITHLVEGSHLVRVTLAEYQETTLETSLIAPLEPTSPARPPKFVPTKKDFRLIRTEQQVNRPPNAPSNPSPENNETNVPLSTILSWQASDPDRDPLTYDVFFEANDSTPNRQIAHNIDNSFISVYPSSEGTTHYWQVIAKDNKGATTSGLIWRFTTRPRVIENQPPDTQFTSSLPSTFGEGLDDEITWRGSDPDGSVDAYEIRVDNGEWQYTTNRGFNVKDLQPGQHTFQVRSIDNLADHDPTPATFTFTIEDIAAPRGDNLVVLEQHDNNSLKFFEGLAYDGEFFYTQDLPDYRILQLTKTLSIANSFPPPKFVGLHGVYYGNGYFWGIDDNRIIRVDRDFRSSRPVVELDNVFPNILAWAGNTLWSHGHKEVSKENLDYFFFKHNPDLSVSDRNSFPESQYSQISGFTYDGSKFWAVKLNYPDDPAYYTLNRYSSSDMSLEKEYPLPIDSPPLNHGLTYDGDNLWVLMGDPASLIKLGFK